MEEELCPLCGRKINTGGGSLHHLVPKTFKGKVTVNLHRICHNKIHSLFTERELLHYYNTIERLHESEEMQKFIKWLERKDPDFYVGHNDHNERLRKRRR